jgi:hypothetical protein
MATGSMAQTLIAHKPQAAPPLGEVLFYVAD